VRLPHPFTRSPRSRSISPHINRAFAAPIHAFAEVTIDITPYQSRVRHGHSRVRQGQDRYRPISIARSPEPFARSRWR
jgi:hypothetical protein